MENHRILTIPNILSIIRILMIPIFILLFVNDYHVAAGVVVLLSGLTDVVDGYIARHFNQISDLGKVIDPIADKLTQGAVVLTLAFTYYEMIPFFVVLAVKEIWMGVMGVKLLSSGGAPFGAFWWGKVSTFALYAYMTLMVFMGSVIPMPIRIIIPVVLCALLILSLINYAPYFYRERNRRVVK